LSYSPSNWYWVVAGSTTQVFSSASGTYVAVSDATYVAWLAAGNSPSRIASEAELSAVLAKAAPGVVVGSPAGLAAYAAAKQSVIMTGGISVNIAASGAPQMVEASTDPASLVLLQGAVSIAQANPAATFQWVPSTGAPVTLTATQINTIFGAVSTFLQETFTTLAEVLTAIGVGSITTKAGVDAPPSPIPAWPANS
jgi:hypothetical protein